MRSLEVLATGPRALIQDLGRPGLARLGVGRSGAADRSCHALAQRVVGNRADAAGIEVTLGGLRLKAHGPALVAVTGAPVPVDVDGSPRSVGELIHLRRGSVLTIGMCEQGLRAYVAVRGGIDVEPELGSCSTDTLSGLGPDPLQVGDRLRVGDATHALPTIDAVHVPPVHGGPVELRIAPGPRVDWIADRAALSGQTWEVSSRSDRIGVRLEGDAVARHPDFEGRELQSEGVVRGSIQVPAGGEPVLFLADHPVTGGYPVAAVVVDADVDRAAQLRPGYRIKLVWTKESTRPARTDERRVDPAAEHTVAQTVAAPRQAAVVDPTVALLPPREARARFRDGLITPTSGWSAGYAQANLICLPREQAYDFLLFAQRNPKPCPLLDVLDAGEVSGPILDGDIRTDVPLYRVYENGELVAEVPDVTEHWRDDLVSFLIGCSFTFEHPLMAAGIPVRHVQAGTNVAMYRTDRECRPAGSLSGPLVVSMRPIPADRVADAVRISSRYPGVHGAPVHIGDPDALGIRDITAPEYGDAVEIRPGEVPVFWACGVTPQAMLMASRPSFAITHAPGHMLVTDARDSEYQVP